MHFANETFKVVGDWAVVKDVRTLSFHQRNLFFCFMSFFVSNYLKLEAISFSSTRRPN